jgi:hypothetical protein
LVLGFAATHPALAGYTYINYIAGTTYPNTTTANVYPPYMYGWVDQNTTGATTPTINEGGSGLNGWVVTDSVAQLPNPNYVIDLSTSATNDATNYGFRFEAFGRYISDFGGAANQGLSIYLNQRAYHLMFDLNAAGDLQATRYGATGGPTVLTTGGTGTRNYHTFSLESSGGTSVTAMFDGRPIGAAWAGISLSQAHANIVLWGNSSQAGTARGTMSYNKITFNLGPIVDVPGDFDGDTAVDGSDMLLWQKTAGSTTNLAADANNDNVVNAADLAVWRNNYGISPTTRAAGGEAPEPASAALALAAFTAISLSHRSRLPRRRAASDPSRG